METYLILYMNENVTYSDPTYEAWKLQNPSREHSEGRIPILPTRHGNWK